MFKINDLRWSNFGVIKGLSGFLKIRKFNQTTILEIIIRINFFSNNIYKINNNKQICSKKIPKYYCC